MNGRHVINGSFDMPNTPTDSGQYRTPPQIWIKAICSVVA